MIQWQNHLLTSSSRKYQFVSVKHNRRCGRGRHGRPWPCEWDVGREPDRDERSEPPAATPPPGELNRWGTRQSVTAETLTKAVRDGATPVPITYYYTDNYKNTCGFSTKKRLKIHTKI